MFTGIQLNTMNLLINADLPVKSKTAILTEGIITSVIGMLTVFCGLLMIYFLLRCIDKTLNKPEKKIEKVVDPDEELAAIIGLSIYMRNMKYYEAKKCILTGKKDASPYMPWVVTGRSVQHNRDERRIHRI